MHLHVAGPLELLEDHVVHPTARVDQRRGEDRQAAALLDVPGSGEEATRPLEGVRVEPAREHLPGGRDHGVVSAREAGDRVQQDHHVLLVLHQPLGLLDHHVGDLDVPGRRLVEGRGDHLAPDVPLHVRDLLGPLVDQQHDEVDLRVVLRNRVGDRLEEHRLAGARRRHDEATLPLPDRREEIHDPGREVLGIVLETDPLHRVERRQVVEEDLVLRSLRRLVVDRLDLQQREVPLRVLRRTHLPGDRVARPEVEPADLGRRDVDVIGSGQVVVVGRPEEPESVGEDLEDAFSVDEPVPLCLSLQDLEDQLLLAQAGDPLHAQVAGDRVQVRDRLLLELGQVHAAAALCHGDIASFTTLRRVARNTLGTGSTVKRTARWSGRWSCAHGSDSPLLLRCGVVWSERGLRAQQRYVTPVYSTGFAALSTYL